MDKVVKLARPFFWPVPYREYYLLQCRSEVSRQAGSSHHLCSWAVIAYGTLSYLTHLGVDTLKLIGTSKSHSRLLWSPNKRSYHLLCILDPVRGFVLKVIVSISLLFNETYILVFCHKPLFCFWHNFCDCIHVYFSLHWKRGCFSLMGIAKILLYHAVLFVHNFFI